MNKITRRLLIFFIGVPVFYVIIFLLPFYRHLALNIAANIFAALCALEFSSMLGKKQIHIKKAEAVILGTLATIAATLTVSFNFSEWIAPLLLMAGFGWVLLSRIFTSSEKMETVISRLVGGFSLIVYPGFFIFWIIKMGTWENSGAIFLFFLLTFFNDSTAWLSGMLFGKNNRGLIPASPNKSIAGFIGGIFASVVIACIAAVFFPSFYFAAKNTPLSNLIVKAVILGLFTSVFANLGDLAESAIKRSSDFKDSGTIMMGRGGALDSSDSLAVAAPVYFLLYSVFFYF
ncbi:MAG: phosphatidate cytidylyltransferase [Treponema sp.]|nr:phosphatidate cytidylyltransferase [Treponema sp.]